MIASHQEHYLIIKDFRVYEWVQCNRQPIDGDVRDTITEVVFKVDRSGDRCRPLSDGTGRGWSPTG